MEDLRIVDETLEGKVVSIGEMTPIKTVFGLSYRIPITVQIVGSDSTITVNVFIREKSVQSGVVHPKSNLYKLLTSYKCKKLSDLVGKTVLLRVDNKGFYRIV